MCEIARVITLCAEKGNPLLPKNHIYPGIHDAMHIGIISL
jgi:hypothetical protein